MKRMCGMLTAAAVLALVCAPAIAAEEREGFKELRGQFVRLTERRVGEQADVRAREVRRVRRRASHELNQL